MTDEERARKLLEYLDAFRRGVGTRPKRMPLDKEGKQPWTTGRFSLDSEKARQATVDGYEAARQIAREGARI